MKSLRLTCLAITAVVSASGPAYLRAQSTRVADPDTTGTRITSLTQVRRPHRAATALDDVQANADVSVNLNVLMPSQMTDTAAGNGATSRGSSAAATSKSSLFPAASPSGSSGSGVANVTSFHPLAEGSTLFRASSSRMRPAANSLGSSSQIRRGGSLSGAPPAGASQGNLPRIGNGLPDSTRSQSSQRLPPKANGARARFIGEDGASAKALARSVSTSGRQASSVADHSGAGFFEEFEDPFGKSPSPGFETFGSNQGDEQTCGEACGSSQAGSWTAFAAHGSEHSIAFNSSLPGASSRLSGSTFGRLSKRSSATRRASRPAKLRRGGLPLEPDSQPDSHR